MSIISDLHFHRKISNDTITLKIIKQNPNMSIYKFLFLRDNNIETQNAKH